MKRDEEEIEKFMRDMGLDKKEKAGKKCGYRIKSKD
jgi:hypothetical protein